MKITILAFGTRGDVQPILALAKALVQKGHKVRMLAGSNFRVWIAEHGVDAAPCSVDMQQVMEGDAATEWVMHGNNPFVNMRAMRQLVLRHSRAMMMDAWNACQGADVIISSILSDVYAVSLVQATGARHMSAWLQPSMVATRSGAATFSAPRPNHDSILNFLFTKTFVEPFLWGIGGDVSNRFRREVLGLRPQTRSQNIAALRRIPVLHGYSRHVVPPPADWPANLHTTGYWFLDEARDWQPPRELVEFIEAGPRPISIGFGSMTGPDPAALTELFVQAVQAAGVRAVLLSGWAGLGEMHLPDSIFCIDAAPHEWLFPRVQAVVHHGGAGTTGASVYAGVPTVIVPHLGDQSFWGQRAYSLGVGPRAIPREKLTARALAAAISRATTDAEMQQRAAELGTRIRSEDGIAEACKCIEGYWTEQGSRDPAS